MLRVRLLGELALESNGDPIPPLPGRPARAVLSWLALHPGMHARSRLAGRLWPNVLDESARGSLRGALASLKRALRDEAARALVTTREQVGLAPEVWVDVLAFEELVAAGRLEGAVELCRGELLPGLDDDWVCDAREVHRARLASALARLGDLADEEGRLEEAIERTRMLLAVDPLSEQAHRALVRRLAAADDRPAALAAYGRLRDRLWSELRVLPSAETRALVDRLRREERARERAQIAAERLPLPAPLARRERSAFVGRAGELALLRRSWERALAEERQLVLVTGEPGIGKTRLTAEFARTAHAAGATVLLGRSYEEPLIAYRPFVEALRPYIEAGSGAGELQRLVPGAAEALRPDVDPDSARFRLFESVSSVLASASRPRPVLLILEDLQWAVKPTLLLLAHLLRATDPARLLIIGTYRDADITRDHPLAETLAELRRERIGERLTLAGLTEEETSTLVAGWLGPSAPRDLAHALHARTQGNPFFVEEFLRHRADSRAGPGEARLPEGVKEVVARRLSRLSDDASHALSLAAVLGREFELRLLEHVVGKLAGERLLDALEEAVVAGVLREEEGRAGRYSFAHELIRETLYDALTLNRRAQLHRRVAEALERIDGGSVERLGQLAHHLFEAATRESAARAADYAARAGELALGQVGYEEAAEQFERALAALDLTGRPDARKRCELLLALGDARMRAGERAHGQEAFTQAAAAARSVASPDLLARAALGYGGIGITIAPPDDTAVRLLEEALEELGDAEAELRATLLARLAVELYYAPERDRAKSLSDEALRLARRTRSTATLGGVLSARHVTLWAPDHVEERLRLANEIVDLAERSGEAVAGLQGRNWRILDLFELGNVAALDHELAEYRRLADELRLPAYQWYERVWRATIAILEGRLEAARRLESEALALGRRAQDSNAELFFRIVDSYHLPMEEGRVLDADLEFQREGVAKSAASAAYRVGVARILAERGVLDEAQVELDRIAAAGFRDVPKDVNWLSTLAEVAEICALLGDGARATDAYELLLPYAPLNILEGRAIYCYGSAAHYLGLLAATASRWDAAARHYEAAIEFHRGLRARPLLCRSLCGYAEALSQKGGPGDQEGARRIAAEALATASDLGMENLILEAEAIGRKVAATSARDEFPRASAGAGEVAVDAGSHARQS